MKKILSGFIAGIIATIGSIMSGSLLPAPSSNYRGRIFTLLSNSGDVTYVCIKNNSGDYIWKNLWQTDS